MAIENIEIVDLLMAICVSQHCEVLKAIRHCILHSHICRLSDFFEALAAGASLIFLAGYSPHFFACNSRPRH